MPGNSGPRAPQGPMQTQAPQLGMQRGGSGGMPGRVGMPNLKVPEVGLLAPASSFARSQMGNRPGSIPRSDFSGFAPPQYQPPEWNPKGFNVDQGTDPLLQYLSKSSNSRRY